METDIYETDLSACQVNNSYILSTFLKTTCTLLHFGSNLVIAHYIFVQSSSHIHHVHVAIFSTNTLVLMFVIHHVLQCGSFNQCVGFLVLKAKLSLHL